MVRSGLNLDDVSNLHVVTMKSNPSAAKPSSLSSGPFSGPFSTFSSGLDSVPSPPSVLGTILKPKAAAPQGGDVWPRFGRLFWGKSCEFSQCSLIHMLISFDCSPCVTGNTLENQVKLNESLSSFCCCSRFRRRLRGHFRTSLILPVLFSKIWIRYHPFILNWAILRFPWRLWSLPACLPRAGILTPRYPASSSSLRLAFNFQLTPHVLGQVV
jgi:hypothetical protein